MNKGFKITLIVLGVLVSVIILDTIQAKIFDNSPLLKIRENLDGGSIDYIDKGIFVNHYHCNNNEDVTTWKKTKFACSIKEEINKNENSLFNNYLLNKICVDKDTNNCLVKENGYRFEGSSPNNYVLLNNELWRIIGIFEFEQKNLIKLIKVNSIGEFKWDSKNINDWENSSLNNYLNTDYLNNLDTSLLEKVNWNIETTNYLLDAQNIYSEEIKKETQEKYYVGLMNVSDYILANPSTNCLRTTKLMDYYKCPKDNWLYDNIKTHSWTINPCNSLPTNANFLEPSGHIADNKVNVEYSVYPVIYLNSALKYNAGDGTIDNPYVFSLN